MIITKEDLMKIIKEELEHVLEVVPQSGVYSVTKQNIAMAKRIEKMYRDAGLTKKADIFARAFASLFPVTPASAIAVTLLESPER